MASDKYKMKRTKRLVRFVVGLNESRNTTLQRLDIVDTEVLDDHVTGSGLHNHLRKLLAEQTKLSRLSLFNGGFETKHGLELLAAVGQNSAHCLMYLNLHNFSTEISPPANDLRIAELCGTFTNLTELCFNCAFLSDDLLNNLSGTLKLITVWVHEFDLACLRLEYSNNGWNVLVSKCTGLKAEYHVEGLYRDVSLWWILLPAVPLATLHWFTHGGTPNVIRPCFDDMINNFQNGLEHLHVVVGCKILSKRDVATVVER